MKALSRPRAALAMASLLAALPIAALPIAALPIAALLIAALPARAESPKESELAGAILFRDKGCSYCHGPAAQGTDHGPSLETVQKRLTVEKIRAQIEHGGQKMPPFGEILTPDQITQLVSFLRAKHRPVAPPAPDSPPLSNPAQ